MHLNVKLGELLTDFKSQLPQKDGLLIRPEVRKSLKKKSQQQNHAVHIASELTTTRRGRKRADCRYRNRVGRKAQALRKVYLSIKISNV